jgi:FkbM family methyltransferase
VSAVVEKVIRGYSVRVLDPERYPYSENIFDDPEPLLARWTFEEGDVAVDVGASFGVYTLLALAQGASVFAFEPSEDGYPVLVENAGMNAPRERATIYKLALGDGELPAAWAAEVFSQHYPATDVRCVYLDAFLLQRIDKMKIDVEGLELHVLNGAILTLRRCRPEVLVEIHDGCNAGSQIGTYPESIGSEGKIEALLRGLDYEIVRESHECGRRYLIGTPREKAR